MLKIVLSVFLYGLTVSYVTGARLNQTCTTPSGSHGRCVPVKACDFITAIFRDRNASQDDKLYLHNFFCGYLPESGKGLVCCPELRSEASCGRLTLENFILGGEETEPEEYPWTAMLGFEDLLGRKGYSCGGTLIKERYVVTAAHCVDNMRFRKLIDVRLGEWDLNTMLDCSETRCFAEFQDDYPVEKVIVHENYSLNDLSKANDIALIKLSKIVERTELVAPICVPTPEMDDSIDVGGSSFNVAGWGTTKTGFASRRKMKVTLPGQTIETCNQAFASSNVTFTETQLCAGGVNGKDTCKGDSGGPLMMIMNNRWHLVGIVSLGTTPCGTQKMPAVYTRFGKYLDWVAGKIELENRENRME
uniref:CLIP domain-containing serine protease n=1 Tax=Aedes albopictus TaxID=7160 RepID=A0A1W7R8K6_AEDAL